jgi:hypothetical protein
MAEDWFTIVLRLALYLDMAAALASPCSASMPLAMTSDPWQLRVAIAFALVYVQ